MFELVQRLFQADIAEHPEDSAAAGVVVATFCLGAATSIAAGLSSPAVAHSPSRLVPCLAGAMFWQAALQGAVNTDGLNTYLDGAIAVPPPEGGEAEKQIGQSLHIVARSVSTNLQTPLDSRACCCACRHLWGEAERPHHPVPR